MESLEISGRTVEDAINLALKRLGVSRDEIKVDVVKEGRLGILGIGGEEAVIRVTPLEPAPSQEGDIVPRVQDVLEKLLAAMGVTASVTVVEPGAEEDAAGHITLDITGEDLGILIGRRGQTLASLQYILRLILANQMKEWVPITLDVEGYKQRRYQTLQNLARRMAEQVQDREAPLTLEPMPAYERRIIHITLAEHPGVATYSIGQGESRKVIIAPKEQ